MELKLLGILLFTFILSGCSPTLTEVNSCIPKVSISSTDDVLFYFREVANKIQDYPNFKNSDDDDNYLCFNERNGGIIDQCESHYSNYGIQTTLLPTGSTISFDGLGVKSIRKGFATWGKGPSPATWFRGLINDRVIWVFAYQLSWMYENKDFKATNMDAYTQLKLEMRMPDPITRDAEGNPINVDWVKREEQEKRIELWDCDL